MCKNDAPGIRSKAQRREINIAVDVSIGDSPGFTGFRVQRTARPGASELHDHRRTPRNPCGAEGHGVRANCSDPMDLLVWGGTVFTIRLSICAMDYRLWL